MKAGKRSGPYRTPSEQQLSILEVLKTRGPTIKTHLMYAANLSTHALNAHLPQLNDKGLIKFHEASETGHGCWSLTPAGMAFLTKETHAAAAMSDLIFRLREMADKGDRLDFGHSTASTRLMREAAKALEKPTADVRHIENLSESFATIADERAIDGLAADVALKFPSRQARLIYIEGYAAALRFASKQVASLKPSPTMTETEERENE